MTNNLYRTILGAILLVALYFDVKVVVYAACIIALFEGITNIRIPKLVNQIRKIPEPPLSTQPTRFSFEAERMFRLMVAVLILATYSLGPDSLLWFFPWFMGFAILGAGVSGLCPALALIKWLGFK